MPLDVEGEKRRARADDEYRARVRLEQDRRAQAHADTIRGPLSALGIELAAALRKERVAPTEPGGWTLHAKPFSYVRVDGLFSRDGARGHEREIYLWSLGPTIVLRDRALVWRDVQLSYTGDPQDEDMTFFRSIDEILTREVVRLATLDLTRSAGLRTSPPESNREPSVMRNEALRRFASLMEALEDARSKGDPRSDVADLETAVASFRREWFISTSEVPDPSASVAPQPAVRRRWRR